MILPGILHISIFRDLPLHGFPPFIALLDFLRVELLFSPSQEDQLLQVDHLQFTKNCNNYSVYFLYHYHQFCSYIKFIISQLVQLYKHLPFFGVLSCLSRNNGTEKETEFELLFSIWYDHEIMKVE